MEKKNFFVEQFIIDFINMGGIIYFV